MISKSYWWTWMRRQTLRRHCLIRRQRILLANTSNSISQASIRLPNLCALHRLPGVWLIPSHSDLTTNDMGLAAGPAAELQFVRDLHSPELKPPAALGHEPFDWIVIDTGPWMGLFTRSALAASHYVIMPVAPSTLFADSGLGHLRRAVRTMSALTGKDTTILGCLVTQWSDDKLSIQTFAPVDGIKPGRYHDLRRSYSGG